MAKKASALDGAKQTKQARKRPSNKAAPAAAKPAQPQNLNKSDDGDKEPKLDVSRLGRPNKLVETDDLLRQIFGLGRLQCTLAEAGSFLFVCENTFTAFLRENPRSAAAFAAGKDNGKISLRRAQMKKAMAGDGRLLVWMGKQMLDQRDKFDGRLAGANGGPIAIVTTDMTPTQAAQAWAETMNGGPG